ncbi:MAG: 30S ribosome-binding factor RbfA [Pseudomonadota bacterium]
MPREFSRSRRVEEQILRLLAELVRREVKDPRVGLVTLTAVEVSKDLSHAKVYFLPFDSKREVAEVGDALASAAGFLRSLLRKRLTMRQVPELHFLPDESIDRAARLSARILAAVADDAARHVDEATAESPADATAAGTRSGPEGGEGTPPVAPDPRAS